MARNRTRRTPKKEDAADWSVAFLAALRETGNVRQSCQAAAVGKSTVYDRQKTDAAFLAACSQALDDATDLLEAEARYRAHQGTDKPVIYKGELMGQWVDAAGKPVAEDAAGARFLPLTIKEKSDTLLIFLLKAHRPEKYREHYKVEHSGHVEVGVEEMTDEQLATLAQEDTAKGGRRAATPPPRPSKPA